MSANSREMRDEMDRALDGLEEKLNYVPDSRRRANIPFLDLKTCGFNLELPPGTNCWTKKREPGVNKDGLTREQWRRYRREFDELMKSEARRIQPFIRPTEAEIGKGGKCVVSKKPGEEEEEEEEEGEESSDSEDEGQGHDEQEDKEFDDWVKFVLTFKRWKSREQAEEEARVFAEKKREIDAMILEIKAENGEELDDDDDDQGGLKVKFEWPHIMTENDRLEIAAKKERKEAWAKEKERRRTAVAGLCDMRRRKTGEVMFTDSLCVLCHERQVSRLVDDWKAVCDACFDSGGYAVVDYDPDEVLDEHTTHPNTNRRRGNNYCRRCCFPHHLELVLYTADLDEWLFCCGCMRCKQLLRVFDHKNMSFLDLLERPIYKRDLPKEGERKRELYEPYDSTSAESGFTHKDSLDEELEESDEDRLQHEHYAKKKLSLAELGDSESEGEKEYKRQRKEKRKAEIKRRKIVLSKVRKGVYVAKNKNKTKSSSSVPCFCLFRQPCMRHHRWLEPPDSAEDASGEEREVVQELAADKVRSLFHKIRYSSLKEKRRLELAADKVRGLFFKIRYSSLRIKRAREQAAAHKVQSLFVKFRYVRAKANKARQRARDVALAEERKRQEATEEEAQKQARWERLRQERANRSPLFNKSVSELKASAVAAGLGRHLLGMAEKAELVALLEAHAAEEAAKAAAAASEGGGGGGGARRAGARAA